MRQTSKYCRKKKDFSLVCSMFYKINYFYYQIINRFFLLSMLMLNFCLKCYNNHNDNGINFNIADFIPQYLFLIITYDLLVSVCMELGDVVHLVNCSSCSVFYIILMFISEVYVRAFIMNMKESAFKKEPFELNSNYLIVCIERCLIQMFIQV